MFHGFLYSLIRKSYTCHVYVKSLKYFDVASVPVCRSDAEELEIEKSPIPINNSLLLSGSLIGSLYSAVYYQRAARCNLCLHCQPERVVTPITRFRPFKRCGLCNYLRVCAKRASRKFRKRPR